MFRLEAALNRYDIKYVTTYGYGNDYKTRRLNILDENGNVICEVHKELDKYHLRYIGQYHDKDCPYLNSRIFDDVYVLIDKVETRVKEMRSKKDVKINITYDGKTAAEMVKNDLDKIYMMTARGSGKTRWISEMFKNSLSFKNHIKDVIFNDPATIVLWNDGSKTVVKCQKGETFDPEKGLAMAISKKVLGNGYDYYEVFNKYVGRYNKKRFNKALEEAKKIPPDEITYNGETYVLKNKEK